MAVKYGKIVLVLIFKPFLGLWKFILKPITLRAYQSYLKLKSKIDKSPILKSKIGFVLYNRNVIYVILVIITLFVASTNLILAKDTKREDVAKKSNLYKLVQPTLGVGDEEIVEKANMNKQQTNYVDTSSNLVAVIPEIAEKDETNSQVMLLGEGTTLASSTVLEKDYSLKRSGIIEYTIEDGDTISMIAERFSVSVSTLYWANNLNSSSYIQPGKTLKIPPGSGVIHKVVSGDTLDSIINKYSGNKELTIKYNDIGSDEMIAVGTELLVADGTPPPPPTPVVKTPSTTISNSWGSFFQPTNNSNVTTGTLNWPSACHSISQNPRWGHIAIDVNCASGTPIYAAESGTATVIPNRGNGYGNYIIINHGNGMQTLYGHMTGFAVSNGQYVTRGQQIGYEGSTGWSTGPHLHFEVKINGANQNPWNYL